MRCRSTTASATPSSSTPRGASPKRSARVEHRVLEMPIGQFGHSALTDPAIAVPESPTDGIPVTYVPARNTVFLACALGYAEVIGAQHIYIGVNAVDYSGYPDCRPAFIRAFECLANLATRAAVEGRPFSIHAPLIELSKADIIRRGLALGVDYAHDGVLLPAGRQRPRLRPLRQLPAAAGRLRGRRHGRPRRSRLRDQRAAAAARTAAANSGSPAAPICSVRASTRPSASSSTSVVVWLNSPSASAR